jgi:hypothetical protein
VCSANVVSRRGGSNGSHTALGSADGYRIGRRADDGKVAYFYGLDTRLGDQVLDAVHVYNVGTVLDHPTPDLDVHLPCDVQIIWSETQERVALLLNGRPHAVFDFVAKRGYCRSNFPASSSWSKDGHGWEEGAVDFLA